MEDGKSEGNKSKRSKSDIKNAISNYMARRNYPTTSTAELSKDQFIKQSTMESKISRPNSILFRGYTIDPIAIDHSFGKLLTWLNNLIKSQNTGQDIDHLICPLFLHLYIDLIQSGHADRSPIFLKNYLQTILERNKGDNLVKSLIHAIANDRDWTILKDEYRTNKYAISLQQSSIILLKKFILESCHVVFMQVLQTWFDIIEIKDEDEPPTSADCHDENKSSHDDEPTIPNLRLNENPLFHIKVSNTRRELITACMRRPINTVALAEANAIRLMPIQGIFLRNTEPKEILLRGHIDRIYSLDISPDCLNILSTSADGTCCNFSLEDFTMVFQCKGHSGPVYCGKFSTDNKYIASGSQDTTLRLWSRNGSGASLRLFVGHTNAVTCLSFHPNCLYLASGSADRTVRLWNVDNAKPMRLLHGCKAPIYALVFTPSGKTLASASDDRKVIIWDLISAKSALEIKCKEAATKLAWSVDSRKLCSGSSTGTVRIWDFAGVDFSAACTVDRIDPVHSQHLNCKLLDVEFAFGTFGVVTTT